MNSANVLPSTILREVADDPAITQDEAAALLGIPRTSMMRRIHSLGIAWNSVSFKLVPYEEILALCHNPVVSVQEACQHLNIHTDLLKKNLQYWKLVWINENGAACRRPEEHDTNGIYCAYCSNRTLLQGFNDLASQYPDLAAEWDNAAINELSSSEVIYGQSVFKGFWKCQKCANIWDNMSPSQRTRLNQGCPYCKNRRTKQGWNDIATLHPELIPLWSERNTYSIQEAARGEKHWWKCAKGHETFSQHYKRIHYGCFQCNLLSNTSQGERELAALLIDAGYTVQQHNRTVLKGFEIDVYLPALKIGFEYNGDYHHSNVVLQEQRGMSARAWHTWKRETAAEQGVELFFVWDYDWRYYYANIVQEIFHALTHGIASDILLKAEGPKDNPAMFQQV